MFAENMTIEEMKDNRENMYFDRKSARIKPKDIAKHIIAFANSEGGTLVIGIEDGGELTGFNYNGAHDINDYYKVLHDCFKNPPKTKIKEIEIKNNKGIKDKILVFNIEASADQVIRSKENKVYLRVADSSRELKHEEITNLEHDKGERKYEDKIVEDAKFEDLSLDLLEEYKRKLKTDKTYDEILNARGFIRKGKYTVGCILLFGNNPTKFLPHARARFIRYDGNKAETGPRLNIIKELEFDDAIPTIIQKLKDAINSQLRDFQALGKDGRFKIVQEYPGFAWLEGVVNALTHRDYGNEGDHIRVIMYNDRLEISSPGLLPNVVTLENLKYTRYSRNPKIARVLAELGWVRELNEGVKRIYEEMEMYFLNDPIYTEPNKNSVKLTLENNIIARYSRQNEQFNAQFEKNILEKLNNEEKEVLNYLFSRGKIRKKEVMGLLGRSSTYSRELLKKLTREEIIKWEGSNSNDPNQYYILNK